MFRNRRHNRDPSLSTEEGEGVHGHTGVAAGRVSVELVAAVRQGDESALPPLSTQCRGHVKRWHRSGLSEDEIEEIVLAALGDAFSDRELSDLETAEALIRALEKHKKRGQRDKARATAKLDELNAPKIQSHEGAAITCEQLGEALEVTFEAMELELPRLTVRNHDLIVRHYELESRFPAKAEPEDLSPSAVRKALYRARRSFSTRLEVRLEARLREADAGELDAVRLALEIVRAEKYFEAGDVLDELTDTAPAARS